MRAVVSAPVKCKMFLSIIRFLASQVLLFLCLVPRTQWVGAEEDLGREKRHVIHVKGSLEVASDNFQGT